MMYLGDYAEDATVLIPFNTFSSNDPAASATITNLADADIKVHKDAGLTQIATDGATVVIDFDSITGNHMVTIDTSVHADYAVGSDYAVRIEGTTVDGGTINAWIGCFSIENRGVAIAKAVWDRVLTGGTHNISNSAGRRLRLLAESGNIYNGLVHLDTVDGTAGTTVGEHGTPDNPTDLLASAKTIAGNIGGGIKDFHLINGSSITLAEDTVNESYFGDHWTLALNGQNITGVFIQGAAVTGIATATAEYAFSGCDIGSVTLDNDGHFHECGVEGTFTVGQAGQLVFINCFGNTDAAWILDFAALGATVIHLFNFNGDVTATNMATGDVLHVTGHGVITTATCTAGTIEHNGGFMYTDAGGNITELKSDIESDVSSILVGTGTDGVLLAAAQGPIVFTGVSNEAGITLIGHGTGAGFEMTGGATGEGLLATGGATSGAGLKSIAGGGGSGVHFAGIGANAGLRADGGATGDGIHAHGGATSGAGMVVHAHANNDDALVLTPHGTGEAEANIALILGDTGELQTDWANGGRLDLLIDGIKTTTDKFTFTVANYADVNIQYVNDVVITGTGALGDEWGP